MIRLQFLFQKLNYNFLLIIKYSNCIILESKLCLQCIESTIIEYNHDRK